MNLLTKEEFIQQYILARASTVPTSLDGMVVAERAKEIWTFINDSKVKITKKRP